MDSSTHIMVAFASKHGATAEIGYAIARGLTERGLEAEAVPAAGVSSIETYAGAVIGSAVYMGHWLHPARDLVDEHATARDHRRQM